MRKTVREMLQINAQLEGGTITVTILLDGDPLLVRNFRTGI